MPSLSQTPRTTDTRPARPPSISPQSTDGDRGNAFALDQLRSQPGATDVADGSTADQDLATAVAAGKVFALGDRGPAVTELQELLGLGEGGTTGTFGLTTEGAVREFQQSHRIEANGKVGPTTLKALKTAKATASAPLIDQYRMNHRYKGGFCGIATLLTTLEAMGARPGVDIRNEAQLEQFSRGIYTPGQGSSGAAMAEKMKRFGRQNATFTTTGTIGQLMANLSRGQPVPVGFVSMGGTVVAAPQASVRYGSAVAVGKTHVHQFGASGHWATVVGFEGDPKSPSHFIVNDSDTGARLRMSRAEFERHSDARTGIWMIPH